MTVSLHSRDLLVPCPVMFDRPDGGAQLQPEQRGIPAPEFEDRFSGEIKLPQIFDSWISVPRQRPIGGVNRQAGEHRIEQSQIRTQYFEIADQLVRTTAKALESVKWDIRAR